MPGTVSVIIPTFNRGYVLREAVQSVLDQGYRDLEVIVVDDGSTDGTGDSMAAWFGAEPRVRYSYQANRGASAARNAGLDLATGAYIAFLDSDDSWEPWHLELTLACLELRPEAGLIWTDIAFVDAPGRGRALACAGRAPWRLSTFHAWTSSFRGSAPLAGLGVVLPGRIRGRPSLCRRRLLGDDHGQPRSGVVDGHASPTIGSHRPLR